ncbi:MAG: Mur ligase domain-containing protein, partial [Lachnospirales bacterium]
MTNIDITTYLHPGRRAHLVGIGGVSMAPLAEVLHGMGMVITGSDTRQSDTVEHLRSLGIQVEIGQSAEHLDH